MLTCGEPLQGRTAAKLLMCLDGYTEKADWRMSPDHTATFAVTPERFIIRLLDCHALEVDFPLADEPRHAIFDVTGLERRSTTFRGPRKRWSKEKAKRMSLASLRTAESVICR